MVKATPRSVDTARKAITHPKRGIPGRSSGSDIVKKGQHDDPDHINKVPIEGHILQGDVVGWSEAMSESLAKETPDDECYANGNVEAVESGDEEKARSIDAASIEPKALVVEVGPFVALNANEQCA